MSTPVRLMDAAEIAHFTGTVPEPAASPDIATGDTSATTAAADTIATTTTTAADPEVGLGALSTERGNLPLEAIDLRAAITSLAVGTELAQTFRNPYDEPLEATYVFPLPDRAAVTALQMEADGRVIEGVLKERGEARADYDRAVAEGRRASIAEQERSDVFTLRVGNIMPGERVVVRLSLAGLLSFEDGAATFRFPLVLAPRYIPGSALPGGQVGDGTATDTDAVPDASRISPPVLLPGFPNPVRLSAEIDIDPAGLPIPDVRSSLHAVLVDRDDTAEGGLRVRLATGERADCDFILRLGFGSEDVVTTSLAVRADSLEAAPEAATPEATFALTLVPPTGAGSGRPKDVTLLLDRSGSMGGWKIVAARRAAARIIDSLASGDRFAVWTFDHTIERPPTLPAGLVPASDRHRFRAVEHLASVDARGGTEMLEPLRQALDLLTSTSQPIEIAAEDEDAAGATAVADTDAKPDARPRDRVLVLVTDGQVGNEDQILQALAPKLGDVRVHTVGVDTAVHEGFLRSLAVLGGGRCELVESEDRLDDALRAIHHRIATPLVTDLRIEDRGLGIDPASLSPARLPDLFAGAPIVITGRLRGAGRGSLALTGLAVDGSTWQQTITAVPGDNASLAAIWARGRIRDLEDRYAASQVGAPDVEREITETSLRFKVLCRFTAFAAVDERVVNDGGTMRRVVQPVESPRGWEMMADADGASLFGGIAAAGLAAPGAASGAAAAMAPMMKAPFPVTGHAPASMPAAAPQPAQERGKSPKRGRAARSSGSDDQLFTVGTSVPARPKPASRSPRAVPYSVASQPPQPAKPTAPAWGSLLPSLPPEIRRFAAAARMKLRQLSGQPLPERAEYLRTLGAELKQHLKSLSPTAGGLFEPWLRVLRELADELAAAPGDAAATQHLWLRTVDVFDAMAGAEEPEPPAEPVQTAQPVPTAEPAQAAQPAQQSRRGTAFWKRG